MEKLVQEIKGYVQVLDSSLSIGDKAIEMLINRTRVYLNRTDVPFVLAGTLAEILVEQSKQIEKRSSEVISSISDNGQSISFSNQAVQTMLSKKDIELFGSHTSMLNRFRKVGVLGVNPFKDD